MKTTNNNLNRTITINCSCYQILHLYGKKSKYILFCLSDGIEFFFYCLIALRLRLLPSAAKWDAIDMTSVFPLRVHSNSVWLSFSNVNHI